ncbi:MAG: CvpA family protein [Bacteroidales bacterium]|nr:CvpA family protein [Bacteroidales bacterium]
MNTLDLIFLVVILIGFAIGCYKGIVEQLTLGAGIVIGLLQAILFYTVLGEQLHEWTGWDLWICCILGFVAIFALIVAIFNVLASVIRWLFKLALLGTVDRILGGLLTALITVFLFVGAVSLISSLDEENGLFGRTQQENSTLYKPMRRFSISFLNEVKKEINEKK